MIFEYAILAVIAYCLWTFVTIYFSYFIFALSFYCIWAFVDNHFTSRKHPPGKTLIGPFSKFAH